MFMQVIGKNVPFATIIIAMIIYVMDVVVVMKIVTAIVMYPTTVIVAENVLIMY